MVKIEVCESIADVRVTGDLHTICMEMVVGVSGVYNSLSTVQSREEADAFRSEFVRMLLTVDAIWEPPDEIIAIDRNKMSDTPTDQS